MLKNDKDMDGTKNGKRIIKTTLVLFALFQFLNFNCVAQKNLIEKIDKWEDVEISGLASIIHKIEGKGDFIWATDYGNGKLYKSSDGGKNWKEPFQFKSEYIEQIQFLDKKKGFVCGDYGYVYQTEDGGETWNEISPKIKNRIKDRFRNDTTKNQKPDGLFIAYYGMHFNTIKNGFISGYSYNPKEGFRKSFKRILYETKNGGSKWNEVEEENKDYYLKEYIKTYNPKYENINGKYYFNSNEMATIEKNKEGKDIFQKEKLIKPVKIEYELPRHNYKRGMLRNILFLNEERGFILGGSLDENEENAIIYETIDRGRTWKYIETELPHIHASKIIGDYIWITGKKGMIKKKKIKKELKKR